jgi:hypothetical protein
MLPVQKSKPVEISNKGAWMKGMLFVGELHCWKLRHGSETRDK